MATKRNTLARLLADPETKNTDYIDEVIARVLSPVGAQLAEEGLEVDEKLMEACQAAANQYFNLAESRKDLIGAPKTWAAAKDEVHQTIYRKYINLNLSGEFKDLEI